jgi:hypothetical protein
MIIDYGALDGIFALKANSPWRMPEEMNHFRSCEIDWNFECRDDLSRSLIHYDKKVAQLK